MLNKFVVTNDDWHIKDILKRFPRELRFARFHGDWGRGAGEYLTAAEIHGPDIGTIYFGVLHHENHPFGPNIHQLEVLDVEVREHDVRQLAMFYVQLLADMEAAADAQKTR